MLKAISTESPMVNQRLSCSVPETSALSPLQLPTFLILLESELRRPKLIENPNLFSLSLPGTGQVLEGLRNRFSSSLHGYSLLQILLSACRSTASPVPSWLALMRRDPLC